MCLCQVQGESGEMHFEQKLLLSCLQGQGLGSRGDGWSLQKWIREAWTMGQSVEPWRFPRPSGWTDLQVRMEFSEMKMLRRMRMRRMKMRIRMRMVVLQPFPLCWHFEQVSVPRLNFSSFSRHHTVAPKHAVLILFVTSRYSELPKQKAGVPLRMSSLELYSNYRWSWMSPLAQTFLWLKVASVQSF